MKNVAIAMQITNIDERELLQSGLALEAARLPVLWFGLEKGEDVVTGITDEWLGYEQIIAFGTVKLARLWSEGKLPPNMTLWARKERFDQSFYGSFLEPFLLNHDAKTVEWGSLSHLPLEKDTFLKPLRDDKAFDGRVFPAGSIPDEMLSGLRKSTALRADTLVLVAPVRSITAEYRNFVVDGKIVSCSGYKTDGRIAWEPASPEVISQMESFLERLKGFYEPEKAYVMDAAIMPDGEVLLVEYNCINTSGFYTCSREVIFSAVANLDSKPSQPIFPKV